ncbi:MAG: helix-turn-helix transcriptional regulator [bacterium]|nr:helix-turn-helix transcriptional regulator [bacterium]
MRAGRAWPCTRMPARTGSSGDRRAGLTQAEAAQRAGTNAAEWSRWESGLAIPNRHQAAVLEALNSATSRPG